MKTNSYEFSQLLCKLIKAIEAKDKKQILKLYDQFNQFDLEKVNDKLFKQYDKLVTRANEVLL